TVAGNGQWTAQVETTVTKRTPCRTAVVEPSGIGMFGREAIVAGQHRNAAGQRQQPAGAFVRVKVAKGKTATVQMQHRTGTAAFRPIEPTHHVLPGAARNCDDFYRQLG